METIEAEVVEQPKQVYDADDDKWVDNPELKKEDPKEEPEKPEDKTDPKKDPKKEEPKKEEPKEEEEEPEELEEEEEEEEEQPVEAKKEDKEEVMDPDAYISSMYGEKFGIKTQTDLNKVIENGVAAVEELETVKKERDTLKAESGKPKFSSEKQQKAFEFISQFDIDRQGEALDTYAKLLGMDVDNSDSMMILEEQFVHQHPEWTRAESQRMFKKEYAKKYTLKRESFDGTDEEFKQEQDDLKIMEKGDIARAKNYLREQKAKYKPAEKEQPKLNENVTKAIEQNAKSYTSFIDKTNELVVGEGDNKFSYKLSDKQKKEITEAMKNWVNNPISYDDKGQLLGISSPDEMFNAIVGGMYLKEIVKSITDAANSNASTKRVDEIAEKKPKKRATPGAGETKVNADDLDAQAVQLIKKRK